MRMAALGCVLTGVLLGAAPLSAQEIVADSITQYTHPADSRAMGWELDDGSAVVLHAEKNPDGSIVALTSVVIATPTGEIFEVVLDGTTGDYMGSPADAVMALYDIDASTLGVELLVSGDEEAGVVAVDRTTGEVVSDYTCVPGAEATATKRPISRAVSRSAQGSCSTAPDNTSPVFIQVNQCGQGVANAVTKMSYRLDDPMYGSHTRGFRPGCHEGGGRYRFDIPHGPSPTLENHLASCNQAVQIYDDACLSSKNVGDLPYGFVPAVCSGLISLGPVDGPLAVTACLTLWVWYEMGCNALQAVTTICSSDTAIATAAAGDNYKMTPWVSVPPEHCQAAFNASGPEKAAQGDPGISVVGPWPQLETPDGSWTYEAGSISCPVQNAKPSQSRGPPIPRKRCVGRSRRLRSTARATSAS